MAQPHLKYRMIYGEPNKLKFDGIKFDQTPSEFNGVAANGKYVAFPWQGTGGGSVSVLKTEKPYKVELTTPKIIGHKGQVLDLDWNPFDDDILATSSADTKVRLWRVPEPFDQDQIEPLVYLSGHQKKVQHCQFNPVAEGILASASQDGTLRIWNLHKGEQQFCQDLGNEVSLPYCMKWNYNGSLLASIWKNKEVKITDPRQNQVVHSFQGHDGFRAQKFSWMGNLDYFCTTGFDNNGKIEVFLWDKRNNTVVQKLREENRSQSTFPFFDSNLNVLYTAAKGDGAQRIYEFEDGKLYFLSEFRDGHTGKAYGFCNKNIVDTTKNELMRMIKITDTQLDFISMIQPRRGDAFQDDLYPDCPGKIPALTINEWLEGKNSDPILIKMDPESQDQQNSEKVFQKLEKIEAKIEVEQPKPCQKIDQKSEQVKAMVQESQSKKEIDELNRQIEEMKENLKKKDQMISELQKKVDAQQAQLNQQKE